MTQSFKVALLTGGGDKPYALGLLSALVARGIVGDFIGSDDLLDAERFGKGQIRFVNLRGAVDSDVSLSGKMWRVLRYYGRLIAYARRTDARIFHILWANRFVLLDRVVLLYYYKMLGKKLVFTAHNINEKERDGGDGPINRITLRALYRAVDHVFVHTKLMKDQLQTEFGVSEKKITVIPFGINNTLPKSDVTRQKARELLGLSLDEKVVLCFGNIAPYKGVEHAVQAFDQLKRRGFDCRLIIAGQVKGCQPYWAGIERRIAELGLDDRIVRRIGYIPDEQVEIFFKATDVLLLPYRFIYQSGVLFLAYSFGMPVIATNVGSLGEDIMVGVTGMICRPNDPDGLAEAIEAYFHGPIYRNQERSRSLIARHGNERYSWDRVAEITGAVYESVSRNAPPARNDSAG